MYFFMTDYLPGHSTTEIVRQFGIAEFGCPPKI